MKKAGKRLSALLLAVFMLCTSAFNESLVVNAADDANVLAGFENITVNNFSAGLNVKKLFDGDVETHGDVIAGPDGTIWLCLDLGETYSVDRWTVTNKILLGTDDFVPLKYQLSLGTEKGEGDWSTVNWKQVALIDNAAKELETGATFDAVDARYVMIEFLPGENGMACTGDNQVRVAEMGLYKAGSEIPEAEEPEAEEPETEEPEAETPEAEEPEAETPGTERPVTAPDGTVNILRGYENITVNNFSAGLNAKKFFDGDIETHGDIIAGPDGTLWLCFDLGNVCTINRWVMIHKIFFDSYDYVPLKYQLSVGTQKGEGDWSAVNWQQVALVDNAEKELEVEVTFDPIDAKYIKVEFLPGENGKACIADNQVRIAEFELYGTGVEVSVPSDEEDGQENAGDSDGPAADYSVPENIPTPVAPGKDIAATRPTGAFYCSLYDKNGEAKYAFDGDSDTYWTTMKSNEDQWITVDLGRVYMIDRWVVESFSEDPAGAVSGYELQVSLDNDRFTKVDSAYDIEKGKTTDRKLDEPVEARFVRLYIPVHLIPFNQITKIASFSVYGQGISENEGDYNLDFAVPVDGPETPGTSDNGKDGISPIIIVSCVLAVGAIASCVYAITWKRKNTIKKEDGDNEK